MNKLTYTSIAALIAAFQQGAKFTITGAGNPRNNGPVAHVGTSLDGLALVRATSGVNLAFNADGTPAAHYTPTLRLELVEAEPQAAEPFLKRFVNGEPAYNPATREVVVGVSFVSGAIEVLLKNEAGIERVSTKYDHEGRHRWVPGRSLVIGKLPPAAPKMKKVELRIYEDRATGGFFLLTPDQNLPNYSRLAGLAPLKTVEVEVKA